MKFLKHTLIMAAAAFMSMVSMAVSAHPVYPSVEVVSVTAANVCAGGDVQFALERHFERSAVYWIAAVIDDATGIWIGIQAGGREDEATTHDQVSFSVPLTNGVIYPDHTVFRAVFTTRDTADSGWTFVSSARFDCTTGAIVSQDVTYTDADGHIDVELQLPGTVEPQLVVPQITPPPVNTQPHIMLDIQRM